MQETVQLTVIYASTQLDTHSFYKYMLDDSLPLTVKLQQKLYMLLINLSDKATFVLCSDKFGFMLLPV